MSYIMCCLWQFNRMTIWNFLVLDCGSARIVFREFTRDWITGTRFNNCLMGVKYSRLIAESHTLSGHSQRWSATILVYFQESRAIVDIVKEYNMFWVRNYVVPIDTKGIIGNKDIRISTGYWRYGCSLENNNEGH